MKIITMLVATLVAMFGFTSSAFGQTLVVTDPVAESPLYATLEAQYKVPKSHDERALLETILYGEYQVNKGAGISVTLLVYHDREYREVIAGVAKQVTDELQLGFGIGKAHYAGESWTVYNPWVYYAKGDFTAFIYSELIPRDREEPRFFKGYAQWKFGSQYFAGLYYESKLGAGPKVGYLLGRGWEISIMRPIAWRSSEPEERVKWLAGVKKTF